MRKNPKKLLSSVSKHLVYILNSHHPLQSKIQEIFKKYSNKSKNEQKEQDSQRETFDSNQIPIMEESEDHGIGSNMTEQGMNPTNNYVPLLNNDGPVNNRYCESEHNPGRFDRKSIVNVNCQT